MAVAGIGAEATASVGLFKALGGAVLGAMLGAVGWFLGTLALGRTSVGSFTVVLAALVGVGAGYGAVIGSGRQRGPLVQGAAVAVTVPMLAAGQVAVMALHLAWLRSALAVEGLMMAQAIGWWDMVVEGFIGTNFLDIRAVAEATGGVAAIPGAIFWALAIANAIAIPRRYPEGDDRQSFSFSNRRYDE